MTKKCVCSTKKIKAEMKGTDNLTNRAHVPTKPSSASVVKKPKIGVKVPVSVVKKTTNLPVDRARQPKK